MSKSHLEEFSLREQGLNIEKLGQTVRILETIVPALNTKKGRLADVGQLGITLSQSEKNRAQQTPSHLAYIADGSRSLFTDLLKDKNGISALGALEQLFGVGEGLFEAQKFSFGAYGEAIDAFTNSYPGQKMGLGQMLGAVSTFASCLQANNLELEHEIVENLIWAYVAKTNGLRRALDFYNDAESFKFVEASGTATDERYQQGLVKAESMTKILVPGAADTDFDLSGTLLENIYRDQFPRMRNYSGIALQILGSIQTLKNIEADKVSAEDWRTTGDLYLEHARNKARAMPWVLVDTGAEIVQKGKAVLHLRTVDEPEQSFMALGNLRDLKPKAPWRIQMQESLLTDGFFPEFEENLDGGWVDFGKVFYGLPFSISTTGEIRFYDYDVQNYHNVGIAAKTLEKVRAYCLWYLAQLVHSDYEVASPRELNQVAKNPGEGGNPSIVRQMPGFLPITDNPSVNASDQERTLDFRVEHRRLLPAGMKPSAKQYEAGQRSGIAMLAYVQDKKEKTIKRVCRIDNDQDGRPYTYQEFLELLDVLIQQYEKDGKRIRVHTYVKRFDLAEIVAGVRRPVVQMVGMNATVPEIDS